jgi:hypothetical protein
VRELKLSLLEKEDHLEEEVEVLRQVISAIIVIKLVIGLMNVILVQEVVDVAVAAVAAAAVVVDIDHTGVEEVEGTEVPQDQKAETIEDIDLLDIKEADVTDEVIAEIVTEGEKESVLTHPDLTKDPSQGVKKEMTLQRKIGKEVKVQKERVSHKAEIDTIHNFKF